MTYKLKWGSEEVLSPDGLAFPCYIGPTAPTLLTFPDLVVGFIWGDTTAVLTKRCTNLSPITFVSIETGLPVTIANGGTGLTTNPVIEAFISGSALKGTGTAPAGDANKLPESAELAVNLGNYDYMAFDQTTEENAFFQYALPPGWDEGTLTFRAVWTSPAGTGTVQFGLKALARSDDDPLDTAFGAEVTVTDTLIAVDDVHISPESAAITIGGTPAEGDQILFNIARKTAADTLNNDARLLGIKLRFTRASYTD